MSFANVLYFGLGYLPSPFMWGFVQQSTGGNHSKWGMVANLGMNLPPILMLLVALKFRTKDTDVIEDDADKIVPFYPYLSKSSIRDPLIRDKSTSYIEETWSHGMIKSLSSASFVHRSH